TAAPAVAGRLRTKRTVLGLLTNGFFAREKAQHRLFRAVRVWTSVFFAVLLFPVGGNMQDVRFNATVKAGISISLADRLALALRPLERSLRKDTTTLEVAQIGWFAVLIRV
ncbi:MAG: hypothetical protein ACPGWR_02820, partial [Ardenticatenaceae bacterium]